jgi:hypothetical protein
MARGDRLAAERRFAGSTVTYTHHGIDVGDGTVVHARPDDPERIFDGGRVARTSAAEFAAGAPIRVITDPPPLYAPDEIAARALSFVGRDGYCPVVENCEHFATWCATGARGSRQVDLLASRVGSATARVAAVVAARAAVGAAERVAIRTALGTTVRFGLRTLLPATLVAEGAAIAAEWSAHQAGHSPERSRRAGESAGMATSAGRASARQPGPSSPSTRTLKRCGVAASSIGSGSVTGLAEEETGAGRTGTYRGCGCRRRTDARS